MDQVVFALAQKTDKDQLLQLLSDRQDEANKLRSQTGNVVKEKGSEYFDNILSNKDVLLIVGKKNNTVIATTTVYLLPRIRKAGYFAIIEDVLVNKDQRGQGIGTLLMKYAIDLCRKNSKVQKIKLGSLLESEKAHQFYKQLGFEVKEKLFQLQLQ